MTLLTALGQEVKLGATYGYSYHWGGLSTTAIGTAFEIGEKYVELQVTSRTYFLDGQMIEHKWKSTAPRQVSVQPHVLFPV